MSSKGFYSMAIKFSALYDYEDMKSLNWFQLQIDDLCEKIGELDS